ncbi:MAG: DUF2231 domain-containing protein [Synechococcaceae cyanobacterium]
MPSLLPSLNDHHPPRKEPIHAIAVHCVTAIATNAAILDPNGMTAAGNTGRNGRSAVGSWNRPLATAAMFEAIFFGPEEAGLAELASRASETGNLHNTLMNQLIGAVGVRAVQAIGAGVL